MMRNQTSNLFRRMVAVLLVAALALGMVTVASAAVPKATAKDVFTFNGHTYKVYENGMGWTQAKEACEKAGGYLATITSQEEQDFIYSKVKDYQKNSYWLGGYASEVAEDGRTRTWSWVTGETWEYTNWKPGQPDFCNREEDKLMMFRQTEGLWNDCRDDGNCNNEAFYGPENFGYVCEWDSAVTDPYPAPVTIGQTKIPEGAFMFKGHAYMVYELGKTWNDANKFCASKGGHLAVITSAEEQEFVKSLIMRGKKNSYWLGATREGNSARAWLWVTGEDWRYSNWAGGMPDNVDGKESCLMMYRNDNPNVGGDTPGSWNDLCYDGTCRQEAFFGLKNFGFVCEWQVNSGKATDISKAEISDFKEYVYTGKAIQPKVTVKMNDLKLVKDVDYTVTYKNNVKVGTASVIIKGKGSFNGKVTKTFVINPKQVRLISLKADIGQLLATWKKGTAITGYEIQYSLKKDFTKPTTIQIKKADTTSTMLTGLKSGKVYYVRIRAWAKVGKKLYYSAWSKTLSKKVK